MHRLRLKANKTHRKSSQDQHDEGNIFNILKLNQGDIVNNWCCGPYHCFDDFLIHFCIYFCVFVSICIRICKLEEIERVPAWCCGRSHCLGLPSIFETQGEYQGGLVTAMMDYVDWIILRHRESTMVLVTAIMDYVQIL